MDTQRFLNQQFSPRIESVSVPALREFFSDDKEPVWVIRGLTGEELGRVKVVYDSNQTVTAMIKAIAGDGDKAKAIKDMLGVSQEKVPDDVARRFEMLMYGSVDPQLGPNNRDVAVKLAQTHPAIFYDLTNRIDALTGRGFELGKPKPSGDSKASERQCTSAGD